ncbi:response regulator transcription factor [Pricia sp.]|uniref:response regulator transcription factor n=1 Tax=Pricia sp. TaxID=2268138 RepID=UPI003593F9B9
MKKNDFAPSKGMSAFGTPIFLSKILEILGREEGTKGLILAVYQLEEKRFLYFNHAFKKIIGPKSDPLFERGWDFWFSNVACDESLMVKDRVRHFLCEGIVRKPMAFNYHIYDGNDHLIFIRHEMVLYHLEDCTMAINYLFDISGKERIERVLKPTNGFDLGDGSGQIDSISPREKEVLTLIGEGYSSKQIADMLYISNHTAISHRKNLIEKFHVRNTAQLIKNASRLMAL